MPASWSNSELTLEQMSLAADQIKELLGLEPHPTCGFVAQTYRSTHEIAREALPDGFEGGHALGSVLYFLVTPDAHIALHRIRCDQMYHHYLGDPLEVLLLYADGSGEVLTVGDDLAGGMRPQLFIPGGTWHVSRVREDGEYALLATTEWPGFEPPDLEVGEPHALAAGYPEFGEELSRMTAQPQRTLPRGAR
jgi:predicted cupin superfamily sugar epimerase